MLGRDVDQTMKYLTRNEILVVLMGSPGDHGAYAIWRCPRQDEPEHWHWRGGDPATIPEPSCEGAEEIPHSDHHGN